jgi:hypothetical protein
MYVKFSKKWLCTEFTHPTTNETCRYSKTFNMREDPKLTELTQDDYMYLHVSQYYDVYLQYEFVHFCRSFGFHTRLLIFNVLRYFDLVTSDTKASDKLIFNVLRYFDLVTSDTKAYLMF